MKKLLLSPLLALCMVLVLLPGTAWAADTSGSCGDNVTWSYSDGTLTIQGTGHMTDYNLGELELLPWYNDYRQQIHTVRIGDGVTSIGDHAFFGCINLVSVTIPNSIVSIGARAFFMCNNLTNVTIPNSVTSIGSGAFDNCSSLVNVIIPDSVTSIGLDAFNGSGLTSVTIPDSVTSIGDGAFKNCSSLTSINVTSGNSAYVSIDGVLFNAGQTVLYSYPAGKNNQSYSVPASVTSIEYFAFYMCNNLTNVSISDSVTRIGADAFAWCRNLASVTIPDSITTIEGVAFDYCDSLKDVYYSGSESQWEHITIGEKNTPLLNANIHYNSAAPGAPAEPAQTTSPVTDAVQSPQRLVVDGKNVDCEKYNIGGSNYFKLRDLAQFLNGTGSQFGVGFDAATATVSIITGVAYKSTGTELETGTDNSATAQPSSQSILINGTVHGELTVYNIGGSNFFQLRELGNLLDFEVDFNAATNTAIVRSARN